MKIAVGADHGGFLLKGVIAVYLQKLGHEVTDVGAFNMEPLDDYPEYSRAISVELIAGRAERGLLICGSGVGASIAANKFPGIRAAVCHDTFSAHQGVEDDDMNVLCLGGRIVGSELAKEIVDRFVSAKFSGAERHKRRLGKVKLIEKEYMKI